MPPQSADAMRHEGGLHRVDRERILHQRGCVVWLTGLSGAGKSTIAVALEEHLLGRSNLPYVLDGDTLRGGLNADLGFSLDDRRENIRRVGEVASLLADLGVITIAALISPFRRERDAVRTRLGARFIEVFVDTPLSVCESRDPKGLYKRARSGTIPEFTGISSPYEPPLHPEVTLATTEQPIGDAVGLIVAALQRLRYLDVDGE